MLVCRVRGRALRTTTIDVAGKRCQYRVTHVPNEDAIASVNRLGITRSQVQGLQFLLIEIQRNEYLGVVVLCQQRQMLAGTHECDFLWHRASHRPLSRDRFEDQLHAWIRITAHGDNLVRVINAGMPHTPYRGASFSHLTDRRRFDGARQIECDRSPETRFAMNLNVAARLFDKPEYLG
jgi:hypothetical protein